MKERKLLIGSLALKLILIISVLIGFTLNYFYGKMTSGINVALYFTVQSNLWIAIIDMVMVVFMIISLVRRTNKIPSVLYRINQVFTVCIIITSLVFLLVLVPGYYLFDEATKEDLILFTPASVLLHVFVPIVAVVDFLALTRNVRFKRTDFLYSIAPLGYYLIFALIGYFLNWDFGQGNNFPYFFLNYKSPAGIFGFSNEMPYFMGSFYWIILLLGIVVGISALLIFIMNKIMKRAEIKNNK